MKYVQFASPAEETVVAVFAGPQDPDVYPNQGEVEDDDPRYLAFIDPPPDYLAINSAKLQQATQLAAAQKTALTNRISTINDAIEFEEATPAEIAELPVRQSQLILWKKYAIALGRVTTQAGWYMVVDWPVEPEEGMDLSVSAVAGRPAAAQ